MTSVKTRVRLDAVTVELEIPGSDLPILRRQVSEHISNGGTLPQYLFAMVERISDKVRDLGLDWYSEENRAPQDTKPVAPAKEVSE